MAVWVHDHQRNWTMSPGEQSDLDNIGDRSPLNWQYIYTYMHVYICLYIYMLTLTYIPYIMYYIPVIYCRYCLVGFSLLPATSSSKLSKNQH